MKEEKPVKKLRGNGLNHVFLDFSKVKDMTLGELYGTNPVPITALTKTLWALIKNEKLVIKQPPTE
jgi:hypothetical protein